MLEGDRDWQHRAWRPHQRPRSPSDTSRGEEKRDSRSAQGAAITRSLRNSLKELRCEELRQELARAELAGEISEFYALSFQAILAMAEGSEFTSDYLEMAEAVAASPGELAVATENRATYDLRQDDPLVVAERCLTALERCLGALDHRSPSRK